MSSPTHNKAFANQTAREKADSFFKRPKAKRMAAPAHSNANSHPTAASLMAPAPTLDSDDKENGEMRTPTIKSNSVKPSPLSGRSGSVLPHSAPLDPAERSAARPANESLAANGATSSPAPELAPPPSSAEGANWDDEQLPMPDSTPGQFDDSQAQIEDDYDEDEEEEQFDEELPENSQQTNVTDLTDPTIENQREYEEDEVEMAPMDEDDAHEERSPEWVDRVQKRGFDGLDDNYDEDEGEPEPQPKKRNRHLDDIAAYSPQSTRVSLPQRPASVQPHQRHRPQAHYQPTAVNVGRGRARGRGRGGQAHAQPQPNTRQKPSNPQPQRIVKSQSMASKGHSSAPVAPIQTHSTSTAHRSTPSKSSSAQRGRGPPQTPAKTQQPPVTARLDPLISIAELCPEHLPHLARADEREKRFRSKVGPPEWQTWSEQEWNEHGVKLAQAVQKLADRMMDIMKRKIARSEEASAKLSGYSDLLAAREARMDEIKGRFVKSIDDVNSEF